VRYAPLVAARGGRVIVEVFAGISPLLMKLPAGIRIIHIGTASPPFDLHCSLLSLPMVFDTDLDSIPAMVPYLTVPRTALHAGVESWDRAALCAWGSPGRETRNTATMRAAAFRSIFFRHC